MYRGRFAPSPTGPLHAGSLATALASWLDARCHQGQWLVRIEDVDRSRCKAQHAQYQLWQLAQCGLVSDAKVVWQSSPARQAAYAAALDQLTQLGRVYACNCSRSHVAAHWAQCGVAVPRGEEMPYPGFCREAQHAWSLNGQRLALRWRASDAHSVMGATQDASGYDDFVLQRADGCFSYHLAVVVDDAWQAVTHVVRGQDLLRSTPRHLQLQQALRLPQPQYVHTPLVYAANGEKLSKQQAAHPVSVDSPEQVMQTLVLAAHHLQIPISALQWQAAHHMQRSEWLALCLAAWPRVRQRFVTQTTA